MTTEEHLKLLREENELLRKRISETPLEGVGGMMNGLMSQMKPIMDSMTKQVTELKTIHPKKMDDTVIDKKKCSIGLTNGGIITIIFVDKEYADIYFDKLRKKK